MRVPRLIVAVGAVVVIGGVGILAVGALSGGDDPLQHQGTGGMTEQEMSCMSKQYEMKHKKACTSQSGQSTNAAAALAKPLVVTAAGLIDANQVDLSGIKGVSKAQQRASEKLLVSTIKTLPKWTDVEQAKADGFQSIGDAPTGEEHFIHWDWIEDTTVLDANRPESLVYRVDRATGARTLEAAMFIMPKQYTLDNPPAIVSPLVQVHIHDNLCFTPPPAPQVRGLTNGQGGCNAPLVKFNPNTMIHVWIRANECGPFASLLGVGAGQIKAGTTRACDMDHGRVGL